MVAKGTPHSPKIKHYWNLTIRLLTVITRTLVGGALSLCILQLKPTGRVLFENVGSSLMKNVFFFLLVKTMTRGVMVKAMDCGIVVSEFVFQSRSLSGKYPLERYESPYP